jgi:hypothetical protein
LRDWRQFAMISVMPRPLDAEFIEVVHQFRRRRRWRHVLAMIIGAIALTLGSAIVAARLAQHATAGLPPLGAGAGLYLAGALLAGWGAAGGFTSRLARWLPATLVLGVLAILAFVLAALFSGETDSVFSNGRPEPSRNRTAGSSAGASPPRAPNRVLATELLDRADIEAFLGPAPADLQTPGARIARSRSLAIWRAAPASYSGGRAISPASLPALSLTVQYSARQARRLRNGRRPARGTPVAGLADGGYVRHHDGSAGRVTRVRASRGDWVVALQLRTAAAGDPGPLLAASVNRMLDLLTAATAATAARPGSNTAAAARQR